MVSKEFDDDARQHEPFQQRQQLHQVAGQKIPLECWSCDKLEYEP